MVGVDLSQEVSAYEAALPSMLSMHRGGWVIFLDREFKGHFETFGGAFDFAMREFPTRDFLIRGVRHTKPDLPFLLLEGR
jgi:hypothetical protein